jgi:WD40 repeat protein/serine/threonine protein kinase
MTASQPDYEAIFHAARDIPDPDRQREYVREACGGDEARIEYVEALLTAADAPDSLLDRPAGSNPLATIDQPIVESAGTVIGPYKLIEQVGEGGMGMVWMAQQTEPVRRRVAVKLIKAGMDSKQVIARFEAERQALALMDHPNIAHVLDAGTTFAGRPYFVMDLVKGVPITRYCDEYQFTPRQRLELFIPVCQAVQHAHQKGIIHRDLKPSNVLVALYDGQPVPKVIDFGVAKATKEPLTDKTLMTGFGSIVGTPEYMSPEQAETNQLDIDTRSDIYSLGVLLYELLAGSPPFTRKELEKAGMLEMLRMIREQEPSKPSTKLSTAAGLPTLAANRGTEPAKLTKLVRGELDWIVMKALEKDRNRRYETAESFALDVQRYLADEPVQACPPSAGYQLRKFLSRNRTKLALAFAVLTALLTLGILAGGALFIDRLHQERERAQSAAARLAFHQGLNLCEAGEVSHGLIWLAQCLQLAPPDAEDLHRAGRANVTVWLRQVHPLRAVFRDNGPAMAVTFSPDGRSVLVGSHDGTVRLWEASTGEPLPGSPVLRHTEEVQGAIFSPDGRTIATVLNGTKALLYSALDGSLIRELPHGKGVAAIAYSPDGRIVATTGLDQNVKQWDAETGRALHPIVRHDREARKVAFSHDGNWLLSGGADQKARVWEAETGRSVAVLRHFDEVRAVIGHPRDRGLVATACGDGKARLWDVSNGQVLREFTHREIVWDLAFSPDGRYVLTGSGDGTARLWETDSGRSVGPPLAHRDAVRAVAFSPDGLMLATASYDGSVRLWGVSQGRSPSREFRHGGPIQAAAFSPDGSLIVTAGNDGTARRWLTSNTAELGKPLQHQGRVNAIMFSPDGAALLTGAYDKFARRWNVQTGELIGQPMPHRHRVQTVAYRPDGQMFLTGSIDQTARLWSAETGKPVGEVMKHEGGVERAAFSPDGRWIVTSCMGKRVYVWDGDSGRPLWKAVAHPSPIRALAVSPDSRMLVIACDDGVTRLWDVKEARSVWELPCKERMLALAFDRDGKRLCTGGADGAARIWDAATGASLTSAPLVHQDRVLAVAFSPDGQMIVTGSEDGTAQLWDAATGRPLGLKVRHQSKVTVATFSPDGRTILTASWDGTARLWEPPDTLEGSVARLVGTVQVLTGLQMAHDEVIRVMDVAEWRERHRTLDGLGGPLQQ